MSSRAGKTWGGENYPLQLFQVVQEALYPDLQVRLPQDLFQGSQVQGEDRPEPVQVLPEPQGVGVVFLVEQKVELVGQGQSLFVGLGGPLPLPQPGPELLFFQAPEIRDRADQPRGLEVVHQPMDPVHIWTPGLDALQDSLRQKAFQAALVPGQPETQHRLHQLHGQGAGLDMGLLPEKMDKGVPAQEQIVDPGGDVPEPALGPDLVEIGGKHPAELFDQVVDRGDVAVQEAGYVPGEELRVLDHHPAQGEVDDQGAD